MTTANNALLPPPAEHERGPKTWSKLRDDERTMLDTVRVEDFQILNTITARLWTPAPAVGAELALEVIADGPYKGVIFKVHNFRIRPQVSEDGFVPVKFSVRVFKAPAGFTHDDDFDNYAREVILAWIAYIQTHDLSRVVEATPHPGIH